jgi:hypothetical protein
MPEPNHSSGHTGNGRFQPKLVLATPRTDQASLKAAIKEGKKLESFLIDRSAVSGRGKRKSKR